MSLICQAKGCRSEAEFECDCGDAFRHCKVHINDHFELTKCQIYNVNHEVSLKMKSAREAIDNLKKAQEEATKLCCKIHEKVSAEYNNAIEEIKKKKNQVQKWIRKPEGNVEDIVKKIVSADYSQKPLKPVIQLINKMFSMEDVKIKSFGKLEKEIESLTRRCQELSIKAQEEEKSNSLINNENDVSDIKEVLPELFSKFSIYARTEALVNIGIRIPANFHVHEAKVSKDKKYLFVCKFH